MKKAIIRKADGYVINVIEITEGAKYEPPSGCYLLDEKASEKASIGKMLVDKEFIDIPLQETKSDTISLSEWSSLKVADKLDLVAKKLGILSE